MFHLKKAFLVKLILIITVCIILYSFNAPGGLILLTIVSSILPPILGIYTILLFIFSDKVKTSIEKRPIFIYVSLALSAIFSQAVLFLFTDSTSNFIYIVHMLLFISILFIGIRHKLFFKKSELGFLITYYLPMSIVFYIVMFLLTKYHI